MEVQEAQVGKTTIPQLLKYDTVTLFAPFFFFRTSLFLVHDFEFIFILFGFV